MSAEKTPAQLLREGADYIAEHGLRQDGEFGAVGESVCAVGSLAVANGAASGLDVDPGDNAWEAWDALEAAVGCVGKWNDNPIRTADEVVAKMREVADTLEATAVAS